MIVAALVFLLLLGLFMSRARPIRIEVHLPWRGHEPAEPSKGGRLLPGWHRGSTGCAFAALLTRLTRLAKPNPPSRQPRKGAYGIRTRAAAVRGRCPRPL